MPRNTVPETDRAAEIVVEPSAAALDQTTKNDQKNESLQTNAERVNSVTADEVEEIVDDFTRYPKLLDDSFDRLDTHHAVRPCIINVGETWIRSKQKNLMEKAKESTISAEDQNKDRNAAFDLLDALTRSGAIPIEDAALHVVIGVNHNFDVSVMDSLVQENRNPIEHVERSHLILATSLLSQPAHVLLQSSQLQRVLEYSARNVVLEGGTSNVEV
jgi:hypothetical protein